jgi:hypothetical protein
MRILAAATVAMMIASGASASERSYFSDSTGCARLGGTKAAESYLAALSSTNTGVVESALAHVAMIKLTVPGCEMKSVKGSVTAIESNGATEEVRYKAWVVKTLMDNPELFVGVAKAGYDEPDALFAALASRMAGHFAAN